MHEHLAGPPQAEGSGSRISLSGTEGLYDRAEVTLEVDLGGSRVLKWCVSHRCPSAPESNGCSSTAEPDLNMRISLSSLVFLLRLLVRAENSSTDQRQACKKHELYVSFRDLGWQVRTAESPCTGPCSVPGDHRAVSVGTVCYSSCLSYS